MEEDGDSDAEQQAMRLLLPLGDSDDCDSDTAAAPLDERDTTAATCHEIAVSPTVSLRVSTHAACGIAWQLWPAAFVAAEYACLHPQLWRGARVCELGAGCGLTGLRVACLGAHVTLTDLPDVAEGVLVDNAAANADAIAACGGGSVQVAPLAWGDAAHIASLCGGDTWDVLLCADVVYRRHLISPLVATLRAMATKDTLVVIAHLKRFKLESEFWKLLHKHFTPREEVYVEAHPQAGQRRPVRVYTCRLK